MKYIIVAPHADDEIIGCWELLRDREKDVRVFYDEPPTSKERENFLEEFPWVQIIDTTLPRKEKRLLIDLIAQLATCADVCCFFPDPHFELHPLHKIWGNVGAFLFQTGKVKTVTFYNTNMNAPYIREVKDAEEKHTALELVYPEKNTLWRYDHKYWLFQGMNQWL